MLASCDGSLKKISNAFLSYSRNLLQDEIFTINSTAFTYMPAYRWLRITSVVAVVCSVRLRRLTSEAPTVVSVIVDELKRTLHTRENFTRHLHL